MKNSSLLVVFFIALTSSLLVAQSNNKGNWVSYFGNNAFGKRFTLWNEIQYRDYKIAGDFNMLLLRAGLGYNLTENNNNILAGYAYIISDTKPGEEENTFHENRLWQQFFNRQTINRVIFQQRYRTEQRFYNDQYQFRFRYMADVILPLTQKKLNKNTIYTHFFNEVFIKANSPKFDRNRLYGGLGYVITPTKRIEVGLLNQTLDQSSKNQLQIYFFNTARLF